jgi:predicted MarR family transcription regulator
MPDEIAGCERAKLHTSEKLRARQLAGSIESDILAAITAASRPMTFRAIQSTSELLKTTDDRKLQYALRKLRHSSQIERYGTGRGVTYGTHETARNARRGSELTAKTHPLKTENL